MGRYEPIIFSDIEAFLQSYLTDQLTLLGDSATVHTEVPEDRSTINQPRFVLVPRVGGAADKSALVVDTPTIGIECWAETAVQAYDLVSKVRALIWGLRSSTVDGVTIYDIQEFAGPANLPDSRSTQKRYVYTVSIQYRGTALTL